MFFFKNCILVMPGSSLYRISSLETVSVGLSGFKDICLYALLGPFFRPFRIVTYLMCYIPFCILVLSIITTV